MSVCNTQGMATGAECLNRHRHFSVWKAALLRGPAALGGYTRPHRDLEGKLGVGCARASRREPECTLLSSGQTSETVPGCGYTCGLEDREGGGLQLLTTERPRKPHGRAEAVPPP